MRCRQSTTKAFTLIEVLLVVVILGAIAAVLVVTIGGQQEQAQTHLTDTQLKNIKTALQKYKMNMGRFPTEEDGGLRALIDEPEAMDDETSGNWAGPYLDASQLKDQWGNEIRYDPEQRDENDRQIIVLISDGPDKEPDTEDDIQLGGEEEDEFE